MIVTNMTQLTEIRQRKMITRGIEPCQEAKAKERDDWLANKAVIAASQAGGAADRIITCRWVLTMKTDGAREAQLVAVGFKDPGLARVESNAPTFSQPAGQIIL